MRNTSPDCSADNMILNRRKHGGDAYWMILDAGDNSMELETDKIGGKVTPLLPLHSFRGGGIKYALPNLTRTKI